MGTTVMPERFVAPSASNSPSSKPPIRPAFLLLTSAPLSRNKRHLENLRRRRRPLRGTDGSNPALSSRESCELAISRRIADCFRRNRSSPTSCARSENGGTGDDCARYAISTQRERGG